MHEDAVDLAAIAALYAGLEQRRGRDADARRHRARRASGSCAKPTSATPASRWRCASPAPGGRDRRRLPRGADRRFPRRAPADLRLQLCRPAEGRAGQFLRLRLRPDRAAGPAQARRRDGATPARKSMRPVYFDGAFRDTPVYDRADAAAGLSARRPGGGRGVRLDHRGVPRPDARRRSARHPDRPPGRGRDGGQR